MYIECVYYLGVHFVSIEAGWDQFQHGEPLNRFTIERSDGER
jgi:hypothetical protein